MIKPASPRLRLSPLRLAAAVVCLLLIIIAWWQVLQAGAGLVTRSFTEDGVPLRYIAPAGADDVPGVLVAHGFAGSKQLMYGYGYALAHAGYGVMLWDFGGHGRNPTPLDDERNTLQTNIDTAYAVLIAQPEIDDGRIALLGHSMGSTAVMNAGITDVARYAATIAISPRLVDVTPQRPRNFLLQAGSLETPFLRDAEELLDRAGGPSDDFAAGTARALVVVPYAEHITILFRWLSHEAAIAWLNQVFGAPATATPYRDVRIAWWLVHLVAWLGLITAAAPLLRPSVVPPAARKRPPWHWLGLVLAPFVASGLLALLSQLGDVSQVGGMLVGGTLALWFLFVGGIWLPLGFRPPWPEARSLLWGLALFALLWVAFGALAQVVWLPWLLIPERLVRWPFLALALLPWMLASAYAQQGAGFGRRVLWWLAQSVLLVAGLGLALALVPSFFFVALILPILPVVLAITAVAGAAVARPWAYAVGNALFFAWVIAAVFPLS